MKIEECFSYFRGKRDEEIFSQKGGNILNPGRPVIVILKREGAYCPAIALQGEI